MTTRSKAFSKIRDYDRYAAAIEKTSDELKLKAPLPKGDVIDSLVDDALSDAPFPQDVISGWEERERIKRNTTERERLLKGAKKQLMRMQREAVQDGADAGLSYLSSELGKLVKDVHAVAGKLSSAPDAEAVIRSGDPQQFEAWNHVDLLIARYGEIRNTQKDIVAMALGGEEAHKFFEVALFRNSLDVSPYWQELRRRGFSNPLSSYSDQAVSDYNKWLVAYAEFPFPYKGIWPTGDRKSYLLHICTTTDLWVPSIREINAAHEAARVAVLPVDMSKVQGAEEARDRFYKVTGSTPVSKYTRSARPKVVTQPTRIK